MSEHANTEYGIRDTSNSALHPAHTLPPLYRDRYFWLALALTVFAVAPLTLPGYFWSANDARHHVYFLYEFNRAVQDGIWWPRWCPDFTFGYGYPMFNIYAPLSHFVAELFLHFGGLSYTNAIETVLGIGIVASAASMYLFVRSWLGRPAALIAALIYTYLPYHLLNLYVRANLAESTAFVWLPLCLWGVRQCTLAVPLSPRRRFWILDFRFWISVHSPLAPLTGLAISYAGLMLTSNLVTVLFTPVLLAYWLLLAFADDSPRTQSTIHNLKSKIIPAAGLLGGLGLSAFFWIPAFLERQFVDNQQWFDGRYDFRPNFVYFFQLFSPRWGFGISQAGPDDPISFQIGVAAFALAVIGSITAWQARPELRRANGFFALVAISAISVALQIAAPLWELPLIGGVLRSAQFPWRWFIVMAPCISVLAGLVVAQPASEGETEDSVLRTPYSVLLLAALIILISYPYLRVQISEPAEGPVGLAAMMRFQRDSDEMTGRTSVATQPVRWSEIAEQYIRWEAEGKAVEPVTTIIDYSNFDYAPENAFAATTLFHNTVSEKVGFDNRRGEGEPLIFNHFYYPGWRAWLLDGENGSPIRELSIVPTTADAPTDGVPGRISVPLPKGAGYLLLRFEDTPARRYGRIISLITLALLIGATLLSSTPFKHRTIFQ